MDNQDFSILKIYASSTDKVGQKLFYEHIVNKAKENEIIGTTVYRGIMGFGQSNKNINSSKFWELTEKLPVVIEIIDNTEKIETFYKIIENDLNQMSKGCIVTLEPINVKLHKK